MSKSQGQTKSDACIREGWEIENNVVWAYGEQFPISFPYAIHLKVYRTHSSQEIRYQAMKRAFEILWPEQVLTYNYWMERIFREHCNFETDLFTLAGGSAIGKSQSAAYMCAIFWLAMPRQRAVVVTSTTLASLKKRIYGYILRALDDCRYKPGLQIVNSPPPTIAAAPPDFIHGIFGVAAKMGTDEQAIKDIIGHHPKNAFLLVLDEAPDMPPAIMKALPNMKKGLDDRFQAVAIGNPSDTMDLHGALSTPINGWASVDPQKDFRWQTTYPNGVCLYFNPYDSPAIHETDPVKKTALGKFLMTEDKLLTAERTEGVDTEDFWRFTMGFWKSASTSPTIVSESFLREYDPTLNAEFSGLHDLTVVAGLDPAFSTGGDKCVLRLAILGHHANGRVILDFRGETLLFIIKIMAGTGKSAELQIADEVIKILAHYKVALNTLCVDASGAGRGLADVIQLRAGALVAPTKIYSTRYGGEKTNSFDVVISSAHEMWFKGREFISQRQIYGLDKLAYAQLHSRLIEKKNGKEQLEKKDDYKKRMATISTLLGRSPDEADAAMLAIQSAILHHGFHPGQVRNIKRYADESSRQFDMALSNYHKEHSKTNRPYELKATFSEGIESLLNKKSF